MVDEEVFVHGLVEGLHAGKKLPPESVPDAAQRNRECEKFWTVPVFSVAGRSQIIFNHAQGGGIDRDELNFPSFSPSHENAKHPGEVADR
jgi:hypothetical protein